MAGISGGVVLCGRVSGVFGVRGWVRVFSYTRPRENILQYSPWLLGIDSVWQPRELVAAQRQGEGLVAHLAGCTDRDQARGLIDTDIAVHQGVLPDAGNGEYYWADLIGARVVTVQGHKLGMVQRLLETGANDVLVVQGDQEHLIPFVQGVFIMSVDTRNRTIEVDWPPIGLE